MVMGRRTGVRGNALKRNGNAGRLNGVGGGHLLENQQQDRCRDQPHPALLRVAETDVLTSK